MDKETQKKRSPNFTEQDCLLLAEIMGQGHPDFQDMKLTFHALDKHRFNSRISSATKRKSWELVAEKFNASASFAREASIVQKKWDNLVSKHRNLYGDYKRNMTLTGRAPTGQRLTIVTEAVMDVIGKDSTAVVGATGAAFDVAFNFLMNQQQDVNLSPEDDYELGTIQSFPQDYEQSDKSTGPKSNNYAVQESSVLSDRNATRRTDATESVSKRQSQCQCCTCVDPVMKVLKKRKLELQIKKLEKELEE